MDDQVKEQKNITLVTLTDKQLREIYQNAAEIGAKEALRKYKDEKKRDMIHQSDRRLRNTRLLLKNYHMLKEHAERSVFGRTQMEESALDILQSMMSMYDNEMIIESIKRSATRTAIIIAHIDTMVGLYEVYCEKSSNPEIEKRRFEILHEMYLSETAMQMREIAKLHNISVRTAYEDLKIALERLSALIFGVDGLCSQ